VLQKKRTLKVLPAVQARSENEMTVEESAGFPK